jgi:uncharacterized protein (TIGR02246 family)
VRTEIQHLVKAFVEATHTGDVSALMDMYSHRPDVASLGNGGISRGWDAIRTDTEQLVGREGSFRVSLGAVDVVPLGPSYALAFTSGLVTTAAETPRRVKLAQVPVAFTFLFERTRDGWKIVHQHASAKQ